MNITNFIIDTSTMPNTEVIRSFTVNGEIGAEFEIIALQNPTSSSDHTKYYDWEAKAFSAGHTSVKNNLKVKLKSKSYNNRIIFVSGGGDFVVKLIAINGTTIFNNVKLPVISRDMSKVANLITLTFQGVSLANSSNYETFPSTTATGAFNSSGITSYNWDISNKNNDTHGFGIFGNSQDLDPDTPFSGTTSSVFYELDLGADVSEITDKIEAAWFFQTTETVDVIAPKTDTVDGAVSSNVNVVLNNSYITTGIEVGDYVYGTGVTAGTTIATVNDDHGSGSTDVKKITLSAAMTISGGVTLTFVTPTNKVKVDDLTDITVGMQIIAVSTGSLTGEPFIVEIDTYNKTLALSSNQAFADGITLTLKADGLDLVNETLGCKIVPSNITVSPTVLTKQVRSSISSANTIPLNNTLGIAGGNIIRYTGVGVDNSSANLIDAVSAVDADGSPGNGAINSGSAQTLTTGAVLTFLGSFAVINFSGELIVDSFPSANRTINFDIDKFLSVGTQSG